MQNIIEKITKSPAIIFIIFGLVFGLAMALLTPMNGVSDEPAHFSRAKEVSQGIWYNKPPSKMSAEEIKNSTYEFHGASGYSPVMYLVSGLSVKIMQHANSKTQFFASRIANLLVWVAIIALAIHITPIFKWAFFTVALFPMSLYEGMSLSADSFSNAFSFLFFAYIFKLIFNDKEFSYKKDIPLLFLFTFIGAMSKGAYFPLFIFPFAQIKKHKILVCSSLLIFAITLSTLWSANNFIALGKDVDYFYNKNFIIEHPIAHTKLIFNTLIHEYKIWYGQLIGCFGWLTMFLPRKLYHIESLMFLSSLCLIPKHFQIKPKLRICSLLSMMIYFICLCSLMFCMCNPKNFPHIIGIQGRYFLSVIPLIFLIIANSKFINIKNTVKILIFVLSAYILTYSCFVLYDNNQYPNLMFGIPIS